MVPSLKKLLPSRKTTTTAGDGRVGLAYSVIGGLRQNVAERSNLAL